jgi:hypothetical protein
MVLDARKSGLQVKPEVLKDDKARYMGKVEWRSHKNSEVEDEKGFAVRPKKLGHFIVSFLDRVKANGRWTS